MRNEADLSNRPYTRALVWFRRDLRVHDNVALAAAAARAHEIVAVFNLDPALLASERIGAPIVQACFDALAELRASLRELGSDLVLLQGSFEHELVVCAKRLHAQAVFYNEDYDPSARARDERVEQALQSAGIATHAHLDHVCIGGDEISTEAGDAYKAYTPFAKRWRERYLVSPVLPVDSFGDARARFVAARRLGTAREIPAPEAFGFASSSTYPRCGEHRDRASLDTFIERGIDGYAQTRDLPAVDATARLSVALRMGTIGIRTVFARAWRAASDASRRRSAEKWISELVWREFYQMVLLRFPHVDGQPFLAAARQIAWRDDMRDFAAWREGRTGFPIVDAAMRQLNETGWMHNRLRMIAASFLTKDLLIDWRWGERYFEQRLADADLAQNNGGWQWVASTGTDAAPYFRVLNPVLQSKKYDPDGSFIRTRIPELRDVAADAIHAPWERPLLARGYPAPIVDHRAARERAIAVYRAALRSTTTSAETL